MPTIKSREIRVQQDIPNSRTLRFWEALKEGKIYTTQCSKCGEIHFPPVSDCANCLSSELKWIELGNEAEIETFTHIVIRPISFLAEKPYTVAIGRLREGVKVLARLTGFRMSEIRIGMDARLVAKTTVDGDPTYEFSPLNSTFQPKERASLAKEERQRRLRALQDEEAAKAKNI
jgi:uncharacterized OB-fold protein